MSHSKHKSNLPDIFLQIKKGKFYDGSERDPREKSRVRRPPGWPTADVRDMVETMKSKPIGRNYSPTIRHEVVESFRELMVTQTRSTVKSTPLIKHKLNDLSVAI